MSIIILCIISVWMADKWIHFGKRKEIQKYKAKWEERFFFCKKIMMLTANVNNKQQQKVNTFDSSSDQPSASFSS